MRRVRAVDDPPALRHLERMAVPLSVLDLSPVGVDVSPSQAIRDSVELARVADGLGLTRYWIAEHHNMASIAISAPEVLIPTRMRVVRGLRRPSLPIVLRQPALGHCVALEAVVRTVRAAFTMVEKISLLSVSPT
jgi:hypothetical protein